MTVTWTYFTRDKAAVLALAVLVLIVVMALGAPYLTSVGPAEQQLRLRRAPPSLDNLLGRDHLGRDMWSRIAYGARYTLTGGFAATLLGGVGGLLLGLFSGFYKGWVDLAIMRFVDAVLAFPFFLLSILIIAILGPGLGNAIFAVGVANSPKYARVVRGSVLQVSERDYIQAARAVGSPDGRIMWRHILPNIMAPLIVLSTVEMAGTVLSIAGLNFLGLGAQPPLPEWGLMLAEGRGHFSQAPHIVLFPGLFITLLVLAFNLVGDGLRYATDPSLRGG